MNNPLTLRLDATAADSETQLVVSVVIEWEYLKRTDVQILGLSVYGR